MVLTSRTYHSRFLGMAPCYCSPSDVMVQWLSVRTDNTEVVSSNPARVTIKVIGKKGNVKPTHKIHLPRKNSEPCILFLLRSKRVCDAVGIAVINDTFSRLKGFRMA